MGVNKKNDLVRLQIAPIDMNAYFIKKFNQNIFFFFFLLPELKHRSFAQVSNTEQQGC